MYKHLQKQKRFSEDRARFYGAQIALALGELHSSKIIYRDMKPENILLDVDGYIALTDYGLAKILEEKQYTKTFCGTPEYMAPEILSGAGHNKQVDWWGLGILLYEMMIGASPFYHKNQHILFQYISTKEVVFPDLVKYGITISDNAKDVIIKLLKKKPNERLGAKNDIDEVMAHPFFKSIDKEKLLSKEMVAEYKPIILAEEKPNGQINSEGYSQKTAEEIEKADPKAMKLIQKNEEQFKKIFNP